MSTRSKSQETQPSFTHYSLMESLPVKPVIGVSVQHRVQQPCMELLQLLPARCLTRGKRSAMSQEFSYDGNARSTRNFLLITHRGRLHPSMQPPTSSHEWRFNSQGFGCFLRDLQIQDVDNVGNSISLFYSTYCPLKLLFHSSQRYGLPRNRSIFQQCSTAPILYIIVLYHFI